MLIFELKKKNERFSLWELFGGCINCQRHSYRYQITQIDVDLQSFERRTLNINPTLESNNQSCTT